MDGGRAPMVNSIARSRSSRLTPGKFTKVLLRVAVSFLRKQWDRAAMQPKSIVIPFARKLSCIRNLLKLRGWSTAPVLRNRSTQPERFSMTNAGTRFGRVLLRGLKMKPSVPRRTYDPTKKPAVRLNRPLRHRKMGLSRRKAMWSRSAANILKAIESGDSTSIEHLTRVSLQPTRTNVKGGNDESGWRYSTSRKAERDVDEESDDDEDMFAVFGVPREDLRIIEAGVQQSPVRHRDLTPEASTVCDEDGETSTASPGSNRNHEEDKASS